MHYLNAEVERAVWAAALLGSADACAGIGLLELDLAAAAVQ